MPAISSLTRQSPVNAQAVIDGETISFVFDRNKLTPYRLSQLSAALEQGDLMASSQMLADQIISWDVTDDTGPYEPTAQNIGKLPMPVLSVLTETIAEASVPGVAEGNASSPSASVQPSETSRPDSPTSPNGSAGSTSPASSVSVS